jgi:hypothetical protein
VPRRTWTAVRGSIQIVWVSSPNACATRRCARINPEFIVAAPNVLHQRVTAKDHPCGVVAFESTHRSEAGFEPPAMVGFDPIVRVLLGVVERGRHELLNDREQGPGPVGHDLSRFVVVAERSGEEPSRGPGVSPCRDVDVDDLAVLVDRPVDVAPPASDLHIGLIDVPPVADRVLARSGRIGQQWCEALHPPVYGDVIDLDPALAEEFSTSR